jgi:hypothetical protein
MGRAAKQRRVLARLLQNAKHKRGGDTNGVEVKHIDVKQRDHDLELETNWETITPEIALKMLEHNSENRKVRQAYVESLVDIMKRGEWSKTAAGIAFDTNGVLLDGQHRLWAIAESGVTLPMLVTRGQAPESRLTIDSGLRRTIHDSLTLIGETVTSKHVSAATAMRQGLGLDTRRKLSRDQMRDFLKEHHEAIDFAYQHLGSRHVRGISTAIMMAVVARAWYRGREELTRLQTFCEVLLSGRVTDKEDDDAAIALRNLLTQNAVRAGRHVEYAKGERACHAFLARIKVTKLYEAREELFPIPNEEPVASPKSKAKRRSK